MSAPYLTLAEASRRIKNRELSPVALTESCFERAEKLQPHLHAFVLMTRDTAMAEARKAESEIAAGIWLGPMHGIPIGIKDIYSTKGVATTCHSNLLKDHIPQEDAETVRRLKDAGAVIMGKLATDEFAFGTGTNLPFPVARNPWNVDHVPSGSSSGSGVGLATGQFLGATGSDTGGSIRSPAASNGVTGIKPTYGLVSRAGIFPLSYTADTAGPMGWTTEDCAIQLQVMAGYDPKDPQSVEVPIPDYRKEIAKPVQGLKVGVIRNFYEGRDGSDPESIEIFNAAYEAMRGLGVEIRDVTLPDLMDFHACGRAVILPEIFAIHRQTLEKTPELYGEITRERARLGGLITAEEYNRGQRFRRVLIDRTLKAMEGLDLLIAPSAFGAPGRVSDIEIFPYFGKPNLSIPFNLSGQPAHAICVGFGSEGLPRSLQIVGRHFDEATVLRLGHAYEKATPWRERRPAV